MPPRDYRIGRRSTATGLAIMRSTPSETRSRRKSSAKRKTPLAVFTGERRECAASQRGSTFLGALAPRNAARPAYVRERCLGECVRICRLCGHEDTLNIGIH